MSWTLASLVLANLAHFKPPADTARRLREDLTRAVDGMCGLFAHLPLRDVPLLQQAQLAPYYDEYWQRWHIEQKHHRFDRNPNTGYSFAQDATLRPAV